MIARTLFSVGFLLFMIAGVAGMHAALDSLTFFERVVGFVNGAVSVCLAIVCLHDAVEVEDDE